MEHMEAWSKTRPRRTLSIFPTRSCKAEADRCTGASGIMMLTALGAPLGGICYPTPPSSTPILLPPVWTTQRPCCAAGIMKVWVEQGRSRGERVRGGEEEGRGEEREKREGQTWVSLSLSFTFSVIYTITHSISIQVWHKLSPPLLFWIISMIFSM